MSEMTIYWYDVEEEAQRIIVEASKPEGKHLSPDKSLLRYIPESQAGRNTQLKKRLFSSGLPGVREGMVYVTTIFNRTQQTTAGQVRLTNLFYAAKMIVDGVARLSSAEDVARFKKQQVEEAARIQGMELGRKNRELIMVNPTPAPAGV
jgi:hypothetical protein